MSFPFTIVTPHGITYQDQVEKVTIPTVDGDITVLDGHTTLIAALKPGELSVGKAGYAVGVAISGGVLDVRHTGDVYILADTAERAEHIDIEKAEKARLRAEELLKQQHNIEDVDFARLQALIEKETVRISVGKKYRK